MCTTDYLIALEREAREFLNKEEYKRASELFLKIVTEAPDFEHGFCFYDLAICLEELGEFHTAEQYYRKALEYQPDDSIRLGGYASFLYLYGDWRVAFDMHLKLLALERAHGNTTGVDRTLIALRSLAHNLHMSKEEFVQLTGCQLLQANE